MALNLTSSHSCLDHCYHSVERSQRLNDSKRRRLRHDCILDFDPCLETDLPLVEIIEVTSSIMTTATGNLTQMSFEWSFTAAKALSADAVWPSAQTCEGRSLSMESGDAHSNPRGCRSSSDLCSSTSPHSQYQPKGSHSRGTSSNTTYSSLPLRGT